MALIALKGSAKKKNEVENPTNFVQDCFINFLNYFIEASLKSSDIFSFSYLFIYSFCQIQMISVTIVGFFFSHLMGGTNIFVYMCII